jgi:lactoylglutathione lyase
MVRSGKLIVRAEERKTMMNYKMVHENYNVFDLEKSLEFYKKALGLTEKRRITAEDGSFIIVYVGNETSDFLLELTWLKDWEKPYNLGDNEFHLAFQTENYEEAHALHEKMGCICYENKQIGIYFINDPDGYWLEIVPER